MSLEFLLTSLIVVLIPGTGALYTISTGLFLGKKQSLYAAFGCTLGIVPHLLASIFGLAAILHTSAVAFSIVKYLGVLYLFYLAYMMYKNKGSMKISTEKKDKKFLSIVINGIMINILNPKLSIFFLAFLPQFISVNTSNILNEMLYLSFIFMLMTFVVFTIYGFFAYKSKIFIEKSPRLIERIQKTFAGIFVFLGLKLAFSEK